MTFSGEGAKETDLYSMGVLLMQLITQEESVLGQRREHIMVDIKESYENGRVKIARKLEDTGCNKTHAEIVTALALQCVEQDLASRPTIEVVIQELGRLD